jgi:deoxyguanosine kinase
MSVDNLLKNIRKRGREYEQNITPEYLETIQNGYFDYFRQVTQFPVLILDTNGIDFVGNFADYHFIKNEIINSEFKLGVTRKIL